ncbi:aldehyde dehydrogenase family protein [Frigidibacter sp. SD6-1]|uniref:aldehyde dehydrogenase family protein n=1 Tax=Frigidibacter sp. SD6-1 TaxID=3032581 RepID=UPI0024DF9E93|nr:aldehyde dehydrogenase family protein [Frigidibacter sp. SD6-1]
MMDQTEPRAIFERHAKAAVARRTGFGLRERRAALTALLAALDRHRAKLLAAMKADYAKNETEATLWEILPVQTEIAHARRHLRAWMRPRLKLPSLTMLGTSARLRPEPKGVALIIAPWNFPVLLALGPVVSALAAGNSVILKPSELTPATSAALKAMLADALPEDLVAVAEGGPEVAEALLDLPFDHIFFTGSTAVGRIVMERAARHLTPVTLELGGKSPVIIGPGADLARAARWIAWGRFANTGQTCVAPDHVIVPRGQEAALLAALKAELGRLYGPDPALSPDYGRIVNARHFGRLAGLIDDAVAQGATIAHGGAREGDRNYIAPTIVTGTTPAMRISDEEIFGPILPVIAYDDPAEAISQINARPKPLALYVFARARAFIRRVRAETTSGSLGVNLTIVQFIHPNLPFGGIGASGLGAGHGRAGFETFSHMKPVLTNRLSTLPLVFPPYNGRVRALTRLLLRFLR